MDCTHNSSIRELGLASKTQGKAKVSGAETDKPTTRLSTSTHSTFQKHLSGYT